MPLPLNRTADFGPNKFDIVATGKTTAATDAFKWFRRYNEKTAELSVSGFNRAEADLSPSYEQEKPMSAL